MDNETTQQLKDIYSALARKEALLIQYDRDLAALKRLITSNIKYMKALAVKRDNTMKEIKQLRAGLQMIMEAQND